MRKVILLAMLALFSQLTTEAQTNLLSADGNVGIGTLYPASKMQIIGNEEDPNGMTFVLGNVNGPNLRLGYNTNYTWMQSHGGRPLYVNHLGNDVILNFAGGYVGIGIEKPTAKLDVRGGLVRSQNGIITPTVNISSWDAPAVGTGGAISLSGKTGNSSPVYSFAYIIGAKETNLTNNYAGYFAIHTVSGGGGNELNSANYERFRVASNGNVGIGTTSPTDKLSVNGKIRAHEIKVEIANWPDYVFADDYQQLPLAKVEEFIKLNKHLPGIPSSAEVQKDGIELGEMNKKLLLKIEELTLSVIDLQKHVSQLHRENENIKKSLKNKNK